MLFYWPFLKYFFLIFSSCQALSDFPLVLVVSYDAFRYDLIEKGATPTLAKLREEGCSADYLENVFVTKTFPNHFSIATGLYLESHGVMGNMFYDPKLKKQLFYGYEMFHYNEDVVPIWIANERKGRHSGVMMWPGCEFNYSGIHPTFAQAFQERMPWKSRVDMALSWFHHPSTPANLVMMYLEEPDGHGHAFGPDSEQAIAELYKMDAVTKYILESLDKSNLRGRVNIFFVSDHGMQTITKNDIIDLSSFVDRTFYDAYEYSPTLHIYPKMGKAKEVYDGLSRAAKELGKFKIYRPKDLPERWHYANNARTPPILLVANPPHVFDDFLINIKLYEKKFNFTATDNSTFGVHGYDNAVETMRPYFIATGPAVRERTRVPPFRTIDLFNIWAELLGFPEAAKATNGSFAPARKVLKGTWRVSLASIMAGLLGGILVVGAMVVTVYFVHRRLRFKYERLLQVDVPAYDISRQRLLESDEEEEA